MGLSTFLGSFLPPKEAPAPQAVAPAPQAETERRPRLQRTPTAERLNWRRTRRRQLSPRQWALTWFLTAPGIGIVAFDLIITFASASNIAKAVGSEAALPRIIAV